jgi:hypothetical protein
MALRRRYSVTAVHIDRRDYHPAITTKMPAHLMRYFFAYCFAFLKNQERFSYDGLAWAAFCGPLLCGRLW